MARPRKQKYDPRQLTFMFDIMADHITSIRSENTQADRREEQAGQAASMRPQIPSVDDESLIRDMLAVSDGTLGTLLTQEGFEVRNYENLGIVRDSWINSQRSSPPFENWQLSWDYYKRTGLFRSVAGAAAAQEKPASDGVQENSSSPHARLGVNSNGVTVYALREGGRMISRDPAIMQTVDGDKDTPENLYSKGKRQYLTVDEVASFAKTDTPIVEVQHGTRQTDQPAGNSQNRAQARINSGHQKPGVHQFGLFDSGQMGAEQPGRTEEAGAAREPGSGDTPGSADGDREAYPVQRFGLGDEPSRDERLGDFGERRDRHEPANYRITPDDRLGVGGAKTKFSDNIAAIRLLKQLQGSGVDQAGPDEKKTFVRYVGWGGLPQAFDPNNEKWAAEYQELQGLLSPDEYAKARRSTQDAHFTSETVIRGIYQGLSTLGLGDAAKPHILEPSAGIGNFIGLCPENINARFMAVELDPTTAAIANYLYPEARVVNSGFHNLPLASPSFDAVIGNPPFGNQALYDPEFPELRKFSIHNYFIAKSLGLLREGGIGAFVVSRFFLDAADTTVREHISQYADFLGAVRLPETAFRQNALTDVTTDIVFLQKNSGEKIRSKDWVHTGSIEAEDQKNGGTRPATVNNYFAANPGQIIGTMVYSGGMFRDALNCVADPALDLGHEIAARLEVLPPKLFTPKAETEERADKPRLNEEFIGSPYFQSLKMGALCVLPQSRDIVFKIAGPYGDAVYDVLPVKNDTARQRLASMIQIRDTLRELINAEKSDEEEGRIELLRGRLNGQYDSFAKRYGHLNSQTNRSLMREDPESSLLESLETEYDKGLSKEVARKQGRTPRPASARKAAIFRKRVLKPAQVVEHAESVKDALVISLRESGKVDFARMERLLKQSAASVQKELREQGLIFLNPASEEWEIRDKYLTGNVRGKLYAAREASQQDERYAANVEALAAAMPPDIEAVDIGVKFGSTWVPEDVVSDFIEKLHSGKGHQNVSYLPSLGRWEAKVTIWDSALSTNVWGIPEYPAGKIIESLLLNRPIKVEKESGQYDQNDRPVMVVDQELTAAAMQKADEIRQAFLDWVWTDDERRDRLTTLYNDRFNTHIPPRYDGSHIELVGASSDVTLRPHQKDVVWRSIQEGTAIFDHVVGAGYVEQVIMLR